MVRPGAKSISSMARAGSRSPFPRLVALSLLAGLVPLACSGQPAAESPLVPSRPAGQGGGGVLEKVLVFSRTAGYRHDAIGPGIEAIRGLGASNGFAVEASEEPSIFNDAQLGEFEVVIWLSTTGDVLTGDQQAAFERYIRAGGGWIGVHEAADT